ncbi:FAD-dependent monooxygenase [Shinella pollutisoli]|uniref:FAD-dependent monooxygenase n=1 Tax=Shinella pollutisoli TaxID=2250594 RepID=A0ABV7DAQ3_9HYPH|nr:FAD-dependent monooxygenase [Shinella pollutisoli]
MKPRALVVGLGIAGMSSAISLKKNGWEPIIVERAPERRTGGYFIGLNDIGKEAAEKLGVTAGIHVRTPENSENWHLTGDGSRVRVAGFADQPTKPATLLRGDIEAGLWQAVDGQIEVRFATTPIEIAEGGERVHVRLRHADEAETEETFDLVVGADGLRSTVRKMVFGPHEEFMHSLNAIICAYQLSGQIETFRPRDGIILNDGPRSLYVFPLQDHTPTALFSYRTDDIDAQFKKPPVETLREAYKDMKSSGIVDEALSDLERAGKNYLFDSVHEVRMPKWHKGRVVLVGDSAWCLTLYSGVGASMAMKGGYELGEAVSVTKGDVATGLAKWEETLRPMVKKELRLVWFKSQIFVPTNGFMFIVRRLVLRLGGRYIAKLSQGPGAAA